MILMGTTMFALQFSSRTLEYKESYAKCKRTLEVYVLEICLSLNGSNSCSVCQYSQVTSTLNWYHEFC